MTLVGVPNMKTAIDDAIEKAGPEYDALVDGVVWMDDKILFQCYRVEGTPLKAKKAPAEYTRDAGPVSELTTDKGHRFVKRVAASGQTRLPREPADVLNPASTR